MIVTAMIRKTISVLLALVCCTAVSAQTLRSDLTEQERRKADIALLNEEVEFSVGMMGALKSNAYGAEIMYELKYSHYNYKGLGFKIAAQYIPELCGSEQVIGVPIAFAYRSPLAGFEDLLLNGLEGMVSSAVFHPENVADNPQSLIASFISGIVSRYEFFVGVTPDYITGEKEWSDARRFGLTADLGLRLNYRIWRFCLNITPAFHYRFTDNHGLYSFDGYGSSSVFEPSRGFFTFSGGLSFMF